MPRLIYWAWEVRALRDELTAERTLRRQLERHIAHLTAELHRHGRN